MFVGRRKKAGGDDVASHEKWFREPIKKLMFGMEMQKHRGQGGGEGKERDLCVPQHH